MNLMHAVVLGVVEGLTEFLPISSTAHMILAAQILGLSQTEFVKFFVVFIQIGAIAAVLFLYFKRFFDKEIMVRLALSFIPTALVGFVLYKIIKTIFFESNILIALSLISIGIVFILLERKNGKGTKTLAHISYRAAVIIGLAQSLSVIPGVSRAGIVMIAMMCMGFKRDESAQYSFMLALPTLAAAALYDLLKTNPTNLGSYELQLLAVGMFTAFGVAYLSMKWFVGYLQKQKLTSFGFYRIGVGIMTLLFP